MISLRINPHWSLTRPKNERIDIHVHKYPESMVNEIKKGWPEYFLFTFGNDVTLDNTSYNIINMPTNGQFYVLLNPQAHPLDKAEWRVFLREMIFIAGEKIPISTGFKSALVAIIRKVIFGDIIPSLTRT